MFGPTRDQSLFIENLQRVVGPVAEVSGASHAWWFAARHRNHDVRVGVNHRNRGLSGVFYATPLTVPARIHIEGHYAHYSHAPVVRTGQPEFDRRYKVHGLPAEVIAAVLDAPTRQWFMGTYGDKSPQTDTENGWLYLYRNYRRVAYLNRELAPEHVPMPEEIANLLDGAVGLSDRVTAGFHATKAAIAQQRGAAAAEQWQEAQAGALLAATRSGARFGIGLVAIFLIPTLAIVATILAMLLALAGYGLQVP